LGALVIAISLYFPINRTAKGGVVLETVLDSYISLAPVWIIPYLGGVILFLAILIAAFRFMPYDMFKAFVMSNLTAAAVAYIIFLVYPTYAHRPTITGTDTLSQWIRWLYSNDRAYNAFPSAHTFYTIIAWLYFWYWQPRVRAITTVLAALVILSTLFTKQHNILDLVGGVVLGVASFWLGRKLVSSKSDARANAP
jgi:membrane-associated phospholipid phosphatase